MAGRGGPARTNGTAASNKICQFKLVLLGESAVGKSSLVLRFVKGQFHEYQESTIGGLCLCFHLNCRCVSCCFHHCPSLAPYFTAADATDYRIQNAHNSYYCTAVTGLITCHRICFLPFLNCFSIYRCWSWRKHVLTSTCLFVWISSVQHVQGRAAEPVLSRRSPISPISQQAPHKWLTRTIFFQKLITNNYNPKIQIRWNDVKMASDDASDTRWGECR